MTKAEKIKEYLEENEDEFNDIVESFMDYDGCWNEDRYYPMEEFGEMVLPIDTEDKLESFMYATGGNDFNFHDDYFCIDSYSAYVSSNTKDYSDYMEEVIEQLINGVVGYIYKQLPWDLKDILDEDEDENEDDELEENE